MSVCAHVLQVVLKVFHAVVDQDTPNLVYKKLKSPRDLLESSGLTKACLSAPNAHTFIVYCINSMSLLQHTRSLP